MSRPVLAITMGDAAGIGPETLIKALSHDEPHEQARCLAVGSRRVLENAMSFEGMPRLAVNPVSSPDEGVFERGTIDLIDMDNVEISGLRMGEVSAVCGRAAYEYIEKSIRLANAKQVAAVVTTPINKESLRAANVPYIGHTEIFGALTNTENPLTMFEVLGLRIFFLSRHVSLRESCELVTKQRIVECAKSCLLALEKLGVHGGTLAVAGLNPHCGEHGLFGDEEVREIAPALELLRSQGLNVVGPVGADSVFSQALHGKYAAVLSLYHDQGHIAAKTLDFERTVSVTCSMPILRTSVDHGTAFDIAGSGKASEISLLEAIKVAVKYSEQA